MNLPIQKGGNSLENLKSDIQKVYLKLTMEGDSEKTTIGDPALKKKILVSSFTCLLLQR